MTLTSTEQPEALRLADELVEPIHGFPKPTMLEADAAAELRRLHARVQELEAQTAHMADLVELADYATKKLEASQAQRVPLSGDDLADVLMSFHGYISGDVADFVAHVEAAHGITQEKQG